jgi:hypothetical protein
MRRWSRKTLRWYRFQFQRLPVLSPGLGASSVQDLNSLCASTFPRTGLTSAYPRRYSGPLLLEPSSSLGASGWLPAPSWGEPQGVSPFRMSIFRGLRAVLYAVSLASGRRPGCAKPGPNGDNSRLGLPRGIGTIPRGLPVSRFGRFQLTTLPAYLRLLPIATCWGRHRLRLAVYPLLTLALRRVFTRHTT